MNFEIDGVPKPEDIAKRIKEIEDELAKCPTEALLARQEVQQMVDDLAALKRTQKELGYDKAS